MGTIRRLRRHQHALICVVALFGAFASASAQAEMLGFAHPGSAPATGFLPQDCFGALPILPETVAGFDQPAAFLSDDAVMVAARTDMDRLAATNDDGAAEIVSSKYGGPIEARITLLFARFDPSGGEIYAAASPKPADFAARRWTPVVSHALLAWAFPAR